MNKFEQVSNDGHQMSLTGGQGLGIKNLEGAGGPMSAGGPYVRCLEEARGFHVPCLEGDEGQGYSRGCTERSNAS